MMAYKAIINNQILEPFCIKPARKRNSLNLKSEIWNPAGPKYFYVYEIFLIEAGERL
jgi:hypothetical protein